MSLPVVGTKARVALCQMKVVGGNKAANLAKAAAMISTACAQHRADIVVLPECFTGSYGTAHFKSYCEAVPPAGSTPADILPHAESKYPSAACLSKAAAEHKVWIVGGSVPELVAAPEGKAEETSATAKPTLYNSSMIFSPDGVLRAVHRKIHLFCIRTETVTMDEADVLTAGRTPTLVEVAPPPSSAAPPASTDGDSAATAAGAAYPPFKMGVGICFDIRFPQLAQFYGDAGTAFLVYPGAFNMVTGPPHWLHAAKSRAIDTQQYVAVCSVARDTEAGYIAYGHSALVDPWGEVVCEAQDGEEIVAGDIDFKHLAAIRARLPIAAGRRSDLYALNWSM